jgi:hypothetical protein
MASVLKFIRKTLWKRIVIKNPKRRTFGISNYLIEKDKVKLNNPVFEDLKTLFDQDKAAVEYKKSNKKQKIN